MHDCGFGVGEVEEEANFWKIDNWTYLSLFY